MSRPLLKFTIFSMLSFVIVNAFHGGNAEDSVSIFTMIGTADVLFSWLFIDDHKKV